MYEYCKSKYKEDKHMLYDWDKMTEEQKIRAVQREMELVTHMGTTKDDLLNMLRWLWDKFEVEG